ncbi:MAG: hypothetical protein ABI550_05230, partial [Ignavibacteriaceae bacterium]
IDYSNNLPPVTTSVKGIHILNSSHIVNGTLNVNETIQLAENFLNNFQPNTQKNNNNNYENYEFTETTEQHIT